MENTWVMCDLSYAQSKTDTCQRNFKRITKILFYLLSFTDKTNLFYFEYEGALEKNRN